MAFGDDDSDSNVEKSSDQKWANINFKNPRHPDQSGSADMQRYFDDAEWVKDEYPSRTSIVGELLSGFAQAKRIEKGQALDRDDQSDLLRSVSFLLTGDQDLDALIEYIEEVWEDDQQDDTSTEEVPADD